MNDQSLAFLEELTKLVVEVGRLTVLVLMIQRLAGATDEYVARELAASISAALQQQPGRRYHQSEIPF